LSGQGEANANFPLRLYNFELIQRVYAIYESNEASMQLMIRAETADFAALETFAWLHHPAQ
jgi:hypothetical protein